MPLFLKIVFLTLLCSLPAFALVWNLLNDNLGANPVETLAHLTGDWTIYFLLLTLAISALNQTVTIKWNRPWLIPFHLLRRVLGLSAFAYALLHATSYFVFDMGLSVEDTLLDIAERPFVLIGFASLLLLIPLVITSTLGWQKKLKKNWRRLHQLTYVVIFLGILHYFLLVKADLLQPLIYLALFIGLAIIVKTNLLKKR